MRLTLIVLAALAVASPSFAQSGAVASPQTESSATSKAKKKMDDPDRIVCTREHVVGSNRPRKVCLTVAERARLKDQAERMANRRTAGTKEDFKGQE